LSERSVALQSKAYQELKEAYTNRTKAALEFKAKGGRVIGCYGCDVPEEIIIAAGMFPLRVCSDVTVEPVMADKYLGRTNPIIGSTIEKILNGTYAEIVQNLAISNSNGAIGPIYEVIRDMSKIFPDVITPPMAFIDLAHTKYMYNQTRNVILYNEFKKTVEKWCGRDIKTYELEAAIKICNEDRAAMRAFDELRWADEMRVTGTEAMVVIGSSMFMDKKRHAELVRELTEEAKSWPVVDAPRILVYGSDHEYLDVYEALEAAGGQAVFEDQNWGARHYDTDVSLELPAIKALVGRYTNRMFASNSSFVAERVAQMKEFIKKYNIEAVLFYMNMGDETVSWDYPSQKKVLDEMGIPSQVYFNQPFPLRDRDGLKDKLAELVNAAKGEK